MGSDATSSSGGKSCWVMEIHGEGLLLRNVMPTSTWSWGGDMGSLKISVYPVIMSSSLSESLLSSSLSAAVVAVGVAVTVVVAELSVGHDS